MNFSETTRRFLPGKIYNVAFNFTLPGSNLYFNLIFLHFADLFWRFCMLKNNFQIITAIVEFDQYC